MTAGRLVVWPNNTLVAGIREANTMQSRIAPSSEGDQRGRLTSIRPRALQSQFRWLNSEHQESAARPVGAARLFLAAQGERPFSHFLSYPLMRFTANVYRRPPDARTWGPPVRPVPSRCGRHDATLPVTRLPSGGTGQLRSRSASPNRATAVGNRS